MELKPRGLGEGLHPPPPQFPPPRTELRWGYEFVRRSKGLEIPLKRVNRPYLWESKTLIFIFFLLMFSLILMFVRFSVVLKALQIGRRQDWINGNP